MNKATTEPRFYFNREEFSHWAACWHLLPDPPAEDWDEFIDRRHVWQLQCRIDHRGVVESEDSLIFRICAQEMLLRALSDPHAALHSIQEHICDGDAEAIHTMIAVDLGKMIASAHEERRALWTSGGEEERARLLREMERLKPPPPFSAEEAEPHIIQRRREQLRRSGFQLTALRRISERPHLSQPIRKLIFDLPPNLPE